MAVNQTPNTLARPATLSLASTRDLLLILLGFLVLIGLIAGGERLAMLGPLRVVLGLVYVLFVPGYTLIAALFPHKLDLQPTERLGLSLGASVAIISLLAIGLNALAVGLHLWPIVLSELAATVFFALVAVGRRWQQPDTETFAPNPRPQLGGWWRSLGPGERGIYQLFALLLVLTIGCTVWIYHAPAPDSYMTEFSMLSSQGRADGFPRQAVVGQTLGVTVNITNNEQRARSYHYEVWASDPWQSGERHQVLVSQPIALEVGQQYNAPVEWAMPAAGGNQQVEIYLFAEDSSQPYRALSFWLDVAAAP